MHDSELECHLKREEESKKEKEKKRKEKKTVTIGQDIVL